MSLTGSLVIVAAAACAPPQEPGTHAVGVARADITPEGPVRLSGYAARQGESDGVEQRLTVTALAIGGGAQAPALLISVDTAAIPAVLTQEITSFLQQEAGIPRERIVLSCTHTHTGAWLWPSIPNMFGGPVPEDQVERARQHTRAVVAKIEQAALAALADLAPARLDFTRGLCRFAANRRTAGGPVDHDVELLRARAPDGVLRALLVNYACHCTTLGGDFNRVCGDWAGYAREYLEAAHPGALALMTIGCGADANPAPLGTLEFAQRNGRELADAVERALDGEFTAVRSPLQARLQELSLAFEPLPTGEQWRERAGWDWAHGAHHARRNLERLERGETLPQSLPYPVQCWSFGDELALAFLGGEVVVDYALRLKHELDSDRFWVSAYCNDVACYIPSERILREGGYEAEWAMIYYDQPARLASGVEDRILAAVHDLLPDGFEARTGIDVARTEGVPPRPPRRSLACMRTDPGLEVQLVACEPLVVDPVAIDFGPDGRLWVAEMHDYPQGVTGRFEPGGRIRALQDRDGDGVFDQAAVFLDSIPFPTGLLAWRQGLLVCAAPDILYAEDGDGDGRAERVRPLFSGFDTGNYQARVNSLSYGLDGWVHGANGLFGGTIRSFSGGDPVRLDGFDFRMNPDTGAFETVTGLTQYGRCRDDFGNWLGCDNGTLLYHYVLEERHLRRNPHLAPPPLRLPIAAGDDPNQLFPISRPSARFNDPGNLLRVTSACGLTIYRDDRLGAEYAGDAFVCEPVHNLVRRLELAQNGSTYAAHPAPPESGEFLSSEDNWFRPVQVRTGPDGALWIVDMYRFVIEHPRWIPAETQAALDLRAGDTMGRIYRVAPRAPDARGLRPWPRLADAGAAELAGALESRNGAVRDQAHMLQAWFPERCDAAAVARIARGGPLPAARAQALAVLSGAGKLTHPDLAAALQDSDAEVRRVALELGAERIAGSIPLLDAALALREDPNPRVRAQLAIVLGAAPFPEAGSALAALLRAPPADAWERAAQLSSLLPHLGPVVQRYFAAPLHDPEVAAALLSSAVAQRDAAAVAEIVAALSGSAGPAEDLAVRLALLAALLDARERLDLELERAHTAGALAADLDRRMAGLQDLLAQARRLAAEPSAPLDLRCAAVAVLGRVAAAREADLDALAELLSAQQDPRLQQAAVERLSGAGGAPGAELLLACIGELAPEPRRAALDALLSRPEWIGILLQRMQQEEGLRRLLDATRRQLLLQHPLPQVRSQAAALLAPAFSGDAQALLARLEPARSLAGNRARGAEHFAGLCATCHALEEVGTALGPDLAALSDKSPQYLLTAIAAPNQAVLEQYFGYWARTADGRSIQGLLAEENSHSVTLATVDGGRQRLLRAEIRELVNTRSSFMPEGLLQGLSVQDAADLLAFLRDARPGPKRFPGNRPEPVPADAGGLWVLRAANASIYGGEICFEEPFQNIGYWSGEADRAEWTVLVDAPVEVEVELEWACDDSCAGNAFLLQGGGIDLRGLVSGTGGWPEYRTTSLGRASLEAGRQRVVLRPDGAPRHALMDLRALRLVPCAPR